MIEELNLEYIREMIQSEHGTDISIITDRDINNKFYAFIDCNLPTTFDKIIIKGMRIRGYKVKTKLFESEYDPQGIGFVALHAYIDQR
jgi:hypothetical protein